VGALIASVAAIAIMTVVGPRRRKGGSAPPSPSISAASPASSRLGDPPLVAPPPTSATPALDADPRVRIGRSAFFDPDLSTPPGTSCASCHDPEHGYAGLNGSERGVPRGSRAGHFAKRATPSVLYLRFVRRFRFHWDEEADYPEPSGGFFWDGRADSITSLVRQPLFNPDEMGNTDARALAARLQGAPYADDVRATFEHAFDTPERAVEVLGESLEAFLVSPAMAPFSSRYDDFVRGAGALTPLEAKGLALFKDHTKGACSGCHTLDDRSHDALRSLFTDYGFDALAVPRNRALPRAAAKAGDLGLCQRPNRAWHSDDDRYCGSFRTPSLRNVALRPVFMHSGVFTKLRDVVAFYATRATNPEKWYPGGGAYDDLPEKYWPNVNTSPAPYNRRRGEMPTLDEGDIDALVAFLETLSDRSIPR
jgi:cytochrome c peroxidase